MKREKYFSFFALTVFFISIICSAQDDCPKYSQLAKQLGTPTAVKININKISTVIQNNNVDDCLSGKSGFEFPRLSKKTAVYNSNLMWGGISGGSILVGGAYYLSGITPGKILQDGTPQNPNLPEVRIYRVRPDYKTSNFENEIADGEGSADQIKIKYEKDWNEWPANDGAPYKDVDNDGKYNPLIDIPGVPGAHQTIWYVANDFDATLTAKVATSAPLGLELQTTVWAYNKPYALGNSIFKKYKITNKKNTVINNMYLAFFVDPDVGDAADDFAGCDTTLNLGYAYNGKDVDNKYGSTPPAVGFVIVQGPLVGGSGSDVGIYNQVKYNIQKNLGMNAYCYFTCGGTFFPCPNPGSNLSNLKWYNYFRGLHPVTNDYFSIPAEFGGGKTKYTLSGDPIAKTGWIDGVQRPPHDRYFEMSTGPFVLSPHETQELVIAEIAAMGKDRFDSIKELKDYTRFITNIYRDSLYRSPEILTGIDDKIYSIPTKFSLGQNYPNPFNPSTVINYQLSEFCYVTLKVYDILGREVATLVDDHKQPGYYNSQFSIANNKLSSGVYYYRLKAGNYVETKKMVLMK
ncbi:MAG: T9SS type A sorting domain-containing protein [Melioribacter sp.]|nr:T9SS type A sorting domain-containing protein [Melioribacter sp.]